MDYFVMSVQHTGTRFLKDVLQCEASHVQHMFQEKWDGTGQLVVPMRHPRKVLQSWCDRAKPMLPRWDIQWDILMNWDTPYIVVPVDTPDREQRLAQVGDFVTNWQPIGHMDTPNELTDEHKAIYADLINKYGDWFSEYYPEL
jgi:hypothetical protein